MATDSETARTQYANYRYCYDNGHDIWVKKAKTCFDFWNGDQWDAAVRARLEREGRPALTLNVIESLVRSMKGIQRALRNDVRFMPVQGANAESARVRDAIWLHVQNQNQLDFLETDIYEKGLIMARAYYDMRVEFDESFQGNIVIRGRRSQDVVLDPSNEEYDPDTWPQVFTRRWVSYNDIRDLYGKDQADAVGLAQMPRWYDYEDIFMSQQMGQLPYYHYFNGGAGDVDLEGLRAHLLLERQYWTVKRKNVFVDVETGDWSEVPENWPDERVAKVLRLTPGLNIIKRDVRTIRWAVTCEGETLLDEDSPYNHFTIVPYFPSYIDGVAKGAVESLVDPQQLYNKITSSELHIISTTANSGYKLKRGSLKNMTAQELEENGARTGFVAELDDVKDLEKIQPNQTPTGHDRLSFKADQIMRSLSGVSDQGRGFAREDVAGEAILANQAAQDINFAGWLSNLHRSKQILARNVLDAAASFYTDTRVLMINQGSVFNPQMREVVLNQPSADGLVVNDVTQGKYTTVLVPAPTRATMSEEDFNLLLKLRTEVGVAIPDSMLIELSPASNKAAIIEMLSGGPDSNERQRQAEELAAQQQQIEQEKALATARKEEAAAQLNQARAEKAAIEAASDPDAAYERVEMARIQVDAEERLQRLELDRQKAEDQRKYQDSQIALRLTELDVNRESADKDRESKASEQSAKRRETKPSTK